MFHTKMEHIWIDSGSVYSASAKGDKVGYLLCINCSSFSCEMLLNMFLMSSDTSARVGSAFLNLGIVIVMYVSTPFLMVEMIVSQPPCTPTAKL